MSDDVKLYIDDLLKGMLRPNIEHFLKKCTYEKFMK